MSIPDKQTINFRRAIPPVSALMNENRFKELAAVAIGHNPVVIQAYGNQSGYPPLRVQLAREYGVTPEQVLVGGAGSLQLLELVVRNQKKHVIFVESPTYDRAITAFRRNGLRVVGIPLEDDGISIEHLKAAIKRVGAPDFLYLVPDSQNPTGVTLATSKRRTIAALAERYRFTIIEDIPYRHLRYTGEREPMMREVSDQVITMSSYSKLIAPGLRVAYVVAPEHVIEGLTKQAEDTYISPPHLNQAIVSEFLTQGLLERQLKDLLALYRPRWKAALAAVGQLGGRVYPVDGGFMLGVALPSEAHVENLVKRAAQAGVAITPGRPFFAETLDGSLDPIADRFLRLPFCALPADEFAEGIKRLSSII